MLSVLGILFVSSLSRFIDSKMKTLIFTQPFIFLHFAVRVWYMINHIFTSARSNRSLTGNMSIWKWLGVNVNTLRSRQKGRHFPDDSFKCIFLNESARISIKISLKFVPKGPIDSIPTLLQKMAWRRPGDKPLSEPMVVTDADMRHSTSMSQ